VTARGSTPGGSGIGTGYDGDGGDSGIGLLILSGTLTLFCDSVRAPNVSVSNASVFAVTPNARLFETTPDVSASLFTIFYGTATGDPREPSLAGVPSISIGNVSLPEAGDWRVCVSEQDCSPSFDGEIRGLFTSVAGGGLYWIVAEGPSRGFLRPVDHNEPFPVSSNGSFFARADFIFIPVTPAPTLTRTGGFVESALPISGPIEVSADFAPSRAVDGTAGFDSSANLAAAQLAEKVTLSTGALVGIVVVAVAAAALVVVFVSFRYCSAGSKSDGGEMGQQLDGAESSARYQTSEFVTNVNPDVTFHDESDELMEERFD
jgi:hypothetical protein